MECKSATSLGFLPEQVDKNSWKTMLGYSTNLVSCDVCVSIKRSNEAWGFRHI